MAGIENHGYLQKLGPTMESCQLGQAPEVMLSRGKQDLIKTASPVGRRERGQKIVLVRPLRKFSAALESSLCVSVFHLYPVKNPDSSAPKAVYYLVTIQV